LKRAIVSIKSFFDTVDDKKQSRGRNQKRNSRGKYIIRVIQLNIDRERPPSRIDKKKNRDDDQQHPDDSCFYE
jgi:hypothetical protein